MREFDDFFERAADTGLLVGSVPGWPGAHSQGVSFLEAWRATGDPQQPHGWIDQS